MKRLLSVLVLCVFTVQLTGCATVKKKFVRKKSREEIHPVVYTEKEFVKPYSNKYYYEKHFNLWKVWHEELVKHSDSTSNSKKMRRAVDESINHLDQMVKLLISPASEELQEEINQIKWATDQLKGNVPNQSSRVKFTLDRSLRVIQSRYDVSSIQEQIKRDEIEL